MIGLEHAAYRMCESNLEMDHLRLQKSLYIAQLFHIGLNGGKLISTNFYAWRYGPVSTELYYQLREYGRDPIPYKKIWPHVTIEEVDDDVRFLDFISDMIKKSKATTTKLINYTHKVGGAWDTARKRGKWNVAVTEQDMLREYEERYPEA